MTFTLAFCLIVAHSFKRDDMMICLNKNTQVKFVSCTVTNSFAIAYNMVALISAATAPAVLVHKVRIKQYMD